MPWKHPCKDLARDQLLASARRPTCIEVHKHVPHASWLPRYLSQRQDASQLHHVQQCGGYPHIDVRPKHLVSDTKRFVHFILDAKSCNTYCHQWLAWQQTDLQLNLYRSYSLVHQPGSPTAFAHKCLTRDHRVVCRTREDFCQQNAAASLGRARFANQMNNQ